ncbi:MAG: hypothetical protein MZV63_08525 [Marinilabiliales bacterium]|nr:hypothetical protein [Marinilabiliales bacterium]
MKQTELITNPDGSIFHLHLLPGDIAENIIIVGDPGRVEMIGQMLDSVRVRKSNREFSTITGSYRDTGDNHYLVRHRDRQHRHCRK